MTANESAEANVLPPYPPVVVVRMIDANPAQVFDAWLDPASLRAFMCPGAIERVEATVDARTGGAFHIAMHEPGGVSYLHDGSYLEIDRPSRLVFTWISEATGRYPSLVSIALRSVGSQTELTLTHERLPNDESRHRHEMGWIVILEKLSDHLARRETSS